MRKTNSGITGRPIEYKMPEALARELLKMRKGKDAKMNPNDYLCQYVNESLNLRGFCTNVLMY